MLGMQQETERSKPRPTVNEAGMHKVFLDYLAQASGNDTHMR